MGTPRCALALLLATASSLQLNRRACLQAAGATALTSAAPATAADPLSGSQCYAVLADSSLAMNPRLEKRGSAATVASFRKTRAVFLGEHHNSAADHQLQADIMVAARQAEPRRPMAVGLEAVQRRFQPVLDAYVAGDLTLAEVEKQTDWEKRWFWPFARYVPVFEAAKKNNFKLLALNADSEDLALVEVGGLKNLPKETLKSYVPSGPMFRDFANTTAFKEYIAYVILPSYNSHKEMGILRQTITGEKLDQDMPFVNFYSGRMLWDNSMATTSAAWLAANPKGLLVNCIGADHVKFGGGVPNRLAYIAGLDLDAVASVVLNPSVVDTAGPQLARLASDEERLPLTLQIRYAAKDGDGGIPVVGGDAALDTGLAAARKQVRAGSRVLPFADYLWMSAAPA